MLGQLLGRGGMAEVFAGHAVGDHGFQKPVAIKRLLPELANDEVFVERLIEEAKLVVGMQHGNIVSVLDLAREGDDVFLVMEFVDGPSLRQLIKSRGARGLPAGVTSYIVQSAAAGLEFAHARPGGAIIHADISPSNLLLTTSGEVRVADFGIARREGLGHGVVEGKWAYMAPEQARGEPLTPASDVFALGVVLYELLTGKHPFGQSVTAHQRDAQIQVAPPRSVRPTVPPGLEAICLRALAHDARDRYGRMQHMIDALVEERFASGCREGAADLAQAIREAAPGAEPGAPRTMHTGRPVTLMTRSLLRERTPPARPARREAARTPRELPVHDATLSTVGGVTTPRPAALPVAVMDEPTHDAAPTRPSIPPLGAHPVVPVARADALSQAAGLLEIPSLLRAEGTPIPPFRLSQVALPGDELASVVGGHTVAGAGAVAVESRGHRWTIGVLVAAAVFGVAAAIAIQVGPDAARPRAAAEPAARPAIQAAPEPSSQPAQPDLPPPITQAAPTPSTAPAEPVPIAPQPEPPASPTAPVAEPRVEQARPAPRRTAASTRPRGEPGILSVQTVPWAWITVGDQTKETPGAKFTLAPGSYVVKFYNEVNGVTKYRRVTIAPGKMLKLSVGMEH